MTSYLLSLVFVTKTILETLLIILLVKLSLMRNAAKKNCQDHGTKA